MTRALFIPSLLLALCALVGARSLSLRGLPHATDGSVSLSTTRRKALDADASAPPADSAWSGVSPDAFYRELARFRTCLSSLTKPTSSIWSAAISVSPLQQLILDPNYVLFVPSDALIKRTSKAYGVDPKILTQEPHASFFIAAHTLLAVGDISEASSGLTSPSWTSLGVQITAETPTWDPTNSSGPMSVSLGWGEDCGLESDWSADDASTGVFGCAAGNDYATLFPLTDGSSILGCPTSASVGPNIILNGTQPCALTNPNETSNNSDGGGGYTPAVSVTWPWTHWNYVTPPV